MARKDSEGNPVVPGPRGAVNLTPNATEVQKSDVFEVMVDAIGEDAIKGDLVTANDVTWDMEYLANTHAIRPAPEYMRAFHEEGLRSSSQPKEGQPHTAPVLVGNAPQSQDPSLGAAQTPAQVSAATPAPSDSGTGSPAPVSPVFAPQTPAEPV